MSRIGGSILPSSDPTVFTVETGAHGRLEVRACPEMDTHALYYHANPIADRPELVRGWTCLATHPNGFSCRELRDRILKVWNGLAGPDYALAQFDYILDCGGMGRARSILEYVAKGEY